MGFHSKWGAQFLTPYSTALDAPPGYITLYAAYFREGNFRLPMTKFTAETSAVSLCSTNPPKSLHDWKQKFFYIRRGVIPIDMHYRAESESVPRINVSVDFVGQEGYMVLTPKATSISQLEERALVGAGMSMLWVPKNPMGILVYGYQGKRLGIVC
ncbi:hypothetical protein Hanom_Chr04g00288281 [Helianthus anomalus]